jgi:hypothetical protein
MMDEMRRGRARSIGAAITLLLSAGSIAAQAEKGSLLGSVVDPTGSPLAGAAVALRPVGGAVTIRTVTADDGRIRFLGLEPGTYMLDAVKEGFLPSSYPSVAIRAGQGTVVRIEMSTVPGESVTVTAEPPEDERLPFAPHLTVYRQELETLPTTRDPWSIAAQASGVLLTGLNVGGTESGAQQNLIGPGSDRSQNSFFLDGVEVTDLLAAGASALYFDFAQFEQVSITTGGADPRTAAPGATIRIETRSGSNRWRGSGRYYLTPGAWQATTSSAERASRITRQREAGVEFGGPLRRDRAWIWAAAAESAYDRETFRRLPLSIDLDHSALKLDLRRGPASARLQRSSAHKSADGRDSGPFRAPETWLVQDWPAFVHRLELGAVARDLSLLASVSTLRSEGTVRPRGGIDAEIRLDEDFVWRGGYIASRREVDSRQGRFELEWTPPAWTLLADVHGGLWYREQTDVPSESWGPRNLIHYAGATWQHDEPIVQATRGAARPLTSTVAAGWLAASHRSARSAFHLGLRYDAQGGVLEAAEAGAHPVFTSVMPALRVPEEDVGFTWRSLSPRLSWSRALGSDGDWTLRAALARYPSQFTNALLLRANPLEAYAGATYDDLDGDGLLDADEPWSLFYASNIDLEDPTRLRARHAVDPGLEPEIHDSLQLGIERKIGAARLDLDLTMRRVGSVLETHPLVRGPDGIVREAERNDYVLGEVLRGALPGGATYEAPVFHLRPDLRFTGGSRLVNGDRRQDYRSLSLSVTRPLQRHWSLRGQVTASDWRWHIGQRFAAFDDPTDAAASAVPYRAGDGADGPGDVVLDTLTFDGDPEAGFFLNSRWSASLAGTVAIAPSRPWSFTLAAVASAREGFPIPYAVPHLGPDGVRRLVQVTERADSYRTDDLYILDLHLEKEVPLRRASLRLTLDGFNVLNHDASLQRSREAHPKKAGRTLEALSPRVLRVGIRLGVD